MRRVTPKTFSPPTYDTAHGAIAGAKQASRDSGIDDCTAQLASKRLVAGLWSDQDAALHFEGNLVLHILLPEPTRLEWRVDTGAPAGPRAARRAAAAPLEMDWGTSVNGACIVQFDPHSLIEARVGAELKMLFYNGASVYVYFKGLPYLSFGGLVSCQETGRPFIYVSEEHVWWDQESQSATE